MYDAFVCKQRRTKRPDLMVGRAKKAESRQEHFSVSVAGSPTKPLTRAVKRHQLTLLWETKHGCQELLNRRRFVRR
jgi:hypothetical protein